MIRFFALLASSSLFLSEAQKLSRSASGPSCREDGKYFDSVLLRCEACPDANAVPSKDGLSCICKPSFKNTAPNQFHPVCEDCGPGKTASQNREECIACSDASVALRADGVCTCSKNNKGGYLVNEGGSYKCKPCANQWGKDPTGEDPQYQCTTCVESKGEKFNGATNKCGCNTDSSAGFQQAGGECLKIPPELDVAMPRFMYRSVRQTSTAGAAETVRNSGALEPVVFQKLFKKAHFLCGAHKELQQCQVLANLCVLELYDIGPGSACGRFRRLIDVRGLDRANHWYTGTPGSSDGGGDYGYKEGHPWLFYMLADGAYSQNILTRSNRVTFKASFDYVGNIERAQNKLKFKLAEYDLEGNYLGMKELKDQLFLCETPREDVDRLLSFGITVQQECSFDMKRMLNPLLLPKQANVFYDMYLEDWNGNLIDVPVYVTNLVNNGQPNSDIPESQSRQWVLTRRFMVLETLTGVQEEGGTPQFLRIAKSIKIKIRLDPDDQKYPEQIFPPYLEISYVEQDVALIDSQRFLKISFTSEYFSDEKVVWSLLGRYFAVVIVMLVLAVGLQALVQCQQERLETDETARLMEAVFKAGITLIDMFSYLMFWLMVFATGYLFIFFKFQERVYLLMPGLDKVDLYQTYTDVLIAVAVCKFLSMAYKITLEQSCLDVFLVDWEPKKRQEFQQKALEKAVLPWRRLFIVNEFSELQGSKHITSEMILILALVFLEGFGLKNYALMEPGLSREKSDSPESYPLNFFIIACVIYGIGTVEYIIINLLSLKYPPPYVDFQDLCSVANISVLIFNEDLKGYYIHGKNPSGYADVSAKRLRLNLENEKQGNATIRGIADTHPDDQTFEIVMPKKLLAQYKDTFLNNVKRQVSEANDDLAKNYSGIQRALNHGPALPQRSDKLNWRDLDDTNESMNKIMKNYVQKTKSQPHTFIREKTFLQRLTGRSEVVSFPTLYPDGFLPSFSNAFLYGLDFDFMMLEVLMIALMDRANYAENAIESGLALGVLIAYLFDSILIWLRKYKGRRELAVHTLCDERFLVH